MTNHAPAKGMRILPADAAKPLIATLGRCNQSAGNWKHEVFNF
jgi:hypothetical protein